MPKPWCKLLRPQPKREERESRLALRGVQKLSDEKEELFGRCGSAAMAIGGKCLICILWQPFGFHAAAPLQQASWFPAPSGAAKGLPGTPFWKALLHLCTEPAQPGRVPALTMAEGVQFHEVLATWSVVRGPPWFGSGEPSGL